LASLFLIAACPVEADVQQRPVDSAEPSRDFAVSLSLAEVDGLTLAALSSVELNFEAEVAIQVVDPSGTSRRTAYTAAGRRHSIPVVGLRADTAYQLRALARDGDGAYHASEWTGWSTGALPDALLDADFAIGTASESDEGVTLFAPSPLYGSPQLPYVVGIDGEGEVVYYYDDPELYDVDETNRQVRAQDDGMIGLLLPEGFRAFDVLGRTRLAVSKPDVHHDALLMPSGNVLALAYDDHEVTDELTGETSIVRGDVVVEISPENETVWSWAAYDHLDTDRMGEYTEDFETAGFLDWTHANALDYDPDTDRIMISLRNQSWLAMVDHATGELLSRMGPGGDYALQGGDWFHLQHGASVVDGGVTVFDNGYDDAYHSRAIHYLVDERGLTATEAWVYDVGFYARTMGDVDLLPDGSYLVTAGASDPAATADDRRGFYRIGPDGATLWSAWLTHSSMFEVFRADRTYWLFELDEIEAAVP